MPCASTLQQNQPPRQLEDTRPYGNVDTASRHAVHRESCDAERQHPQPRQPREFSGHACEPRAAALGLEQLQLCQRRHRTELRSFQAGHAAVDEAQPLRQAKTSCSRNLVPTLQ